MDRSRCSFSPVGALPLAKGKAPREGGLCFRRFETTVTTNFLLTDSIG